jgi:hypothetical protein
MEPVPARLFTDAEIKELQVLLRTHVGVSLSTEQAQTVAHQLSRVLWLIREVLLEGSTDSTSLVDGRALPELSKHGITTRPTH